MRGQSLHPGMWRCEWDGHRHQNRWNRKIGDSRYKHPGSGDSPRILEGGGVSGTGAVIRTAGTRKLVTVVTKPHGSGDSPHLVGCGGVSGTGAVIRTAGIRKLVTDVTKPPGSGDSPCIWQVVVCVGRGGSGGWSPVSLKKPNSESRLTRSHIATHKKRLSRAP